VVVARGEAGAVALDGLRVVELADEKGIYCGKLLADLGANVVKVESPAHPRDAFSRYADAGKRSIALDLESADGRAALAMLVAGSDLVIETDASARLDALEIGFETLRCMRPTLVWTSITGFGLTGPMADCASANIVAAALGGAMHVTGAPEDPPVVLAGNPSWIAASTAAAAASLIALREAALSGRGQRVDISVLEVVAAVTHICGAAKYLEDGIVPRRFGSGLFASVPSGAYRAGDGKHVYLMVNRPAHWRALAAWVNEITGNTEILDPMFEGPSSARQPYRDLLDLLIGEMTVRFSADDLYREGQRRHIAITPLAGALDVIADPHLAHRELFVSVEGPDGASYRQPGAPYRLSRTPVRIVRGAPLAGAHTDEVLRELDVDSAGDADAPLEVGVVPPSRGPALAGLRVLELSAGMAGPWVGRFMAYCGADVVKIESREHADVSRLYVSPREPEKGVQETASPWFTDWNAGKRFVALDLAKPRAVEILKQLVATCDVVVANYAAGVLGKLGLDYATLSSVKPDLVMLSSTGYGSTGPNRNYVTWGPNIEALSGVATLSGFPQRECTITQYAYPDALSALHGLVAVMAALVHRDLTGEGQLIDLSQYEATVASIGHLFLDPLAEDVEPSRLGNQSSEHAPHGCYRCAGEDRWCAIAVKSDDDWRRLCEAMGKGALAGNARFATAQFRIRRRKEVDREIEAWTSTRDPYEVMRTLQSAGVAAGVVQNIADQLERDVQLAARGFFEKIPHRDGRTVVANGIPLGLTETPGHTRDTGRPIGADNADVLCELLGLTSVEIADLLASRAVES
jgi:crotonobetainyl-CoA:carnitine CoA-transferase CaiB-like acyl-CoA transferase